jgi:hypothetical protein
LGRFVERDEREMETGERDERRSGVSEAADELEEEENRLRGNNEGGQENEENKRQTRGDVNERNMAMNWRARDKKYECDS